MSTIKVINGKLSAADKKKLTNGFKFMYEDKNGVLSGAAIGLEVANVVEANKSETGKVKSGFFCMGYIAKLVTLHATTLEPRAKGQNFVMLDELTDLPKLQNITITGAKGSETKADHPYTYASISEFLKKHDIDKWTPRAKASKGAKPEVKMNKEW